MSELKMSEECIMSRGKNVRSKNVRGKYVKKCPTPNINILQQWRIRVERVGGGGGGTGAPVT